MGGKQHLLKAGNSRNPESPPKSPLRGVDSPTTRPGSKQTSFMGQRNKTLNLGNLAK
jgi:hypothetical protein